MNNKKIEMQSKKAYRKPEMEVVFFGLHEPLMEDGKNTMDACILPCSTNP